MYPTISHLIKDLTGFWIPLHIQTFGFFVAMAFLLAAYVLKRELRRKEKEGLIHSVFNKKGDSVRPDQQVWNIVLIAAIAGIIGARIFSILEYPDDFIKAPWETIFSTSGLTFYGGLILGSIAVIIYARRIDLEIVHLLDAAAPALMLAYAVGRIGCHLSGDGDWGVDNLMPKPAWLNVLPDWAWAYRYPHNVIMEGVSIPGCSGSYCTILQNPVFPTPLYEMALCMFLFFFLWFIRKKIKISGIVFSVYLILNGLERFLIEQIRVDSEFRFLGIWMKQAELVGVLLMVTGIVFLLYFMTNSKKIEIENF
jgi:prolipoprotein diacylglyceryl transferase